MTDPTPTGRGRSMDGAPLTLNVRLLGELRRLAGRPEVRLRLPAGSTIRTLTAELARICDPAFAQGALSRNGDIQSHVAVFFNGSQLPSAGQAPLPLADGDVEFLIVPMYEGG